MSVASTIFAAHGRPVLLEQFGDAGQVTYTPTGGSAVELTAILGQKEEEEEDGLLGKELHRRRVIKISTDPTSPGGGVADPEVNASVVIGSVEYAIKEIEEGALAVLHLERAGSAERTRPGYRGQ